MDKNKKSIVSLFDENKAKFMEHEKLANNLEAENLKTFLVQNQSPTSKQS